MKISYSWLKEYIDFEQTPEQISEILTQTGLEVEGIEHVEKIPGGLAGIVLGEVVACSQHPNADKLKVTKVDIGLPELSDIVCGAPNVAKGQKVLVATVNSTIYPTNGEPFKIKKAKIRGEVSLGMICAEDEIGLGINHDGIMVLDTDKPNGTPAIELFDTGVDYVIEIGLTPNRGDATSHMGSARDLKAFFKKELTLPQPSKFEIRFDNPIKVTVENTEACPRYSGVTIRNVVVSESPDWLKWKLKCIGLEPINNIVDATNYVLHALGQPMHAFDADEIKGGEVIVKTLPAGSRFVTLDEKERKLDAKDLMICNGESEGMCIAGVFGGIKSGVKDTTQNIFLEVAYFAPDWVRSAAQRHGLSTDASFRYERGTDPDLTIYALKLATSMILELAGGYVASEITDIYPEPINKQEVSVTFRYIHKIIGKKLSEKRILEILNWLDIETINQTGDGFTAVVPNYRSDVTRPADIVEEILRIYGFNEVELDEHFSSDYLAEFKEVEPYRVQEEVTKYLAGKGYAEIFTNSLTNPAYKKAYPLGGEPVTMLNPSSEELAVMKTSPLYTALESVAYNINRRFPNLKFLEFSKSYEKAENYKETEWLLLINTGANHEPYWQDEARKSSLFDLNNTVESLLKFLSVGDIRNEALDTDDVFEYGLGLSLNKKLIGKAGKLANGLLQLYGIKQDVFACMIDWKSLVKYYKTAISYRPISKFPEVKRDLSLVLDKSVSFAEVQQLASRQEKKLLNRINLFSVYEGEKIEEGKKAYAISFFLQDNFKTLSDKQIEKSMNALMSAYEKELGAVIRK